MNLKEAQRLAKEKYGHHCRPGNVMFLRWEDGWCHELTHDGKKLILMRYRKDWDNLDILTFQYYNGKARRWEWTNGKPV